jgi:hypothetical protein
LPPPPPDLFRAHSLVPQQRLLARRDSSPAPFRR